MFNVLKKSRVLAALVGVALSAASASASVTYSLNATPLGVKPLGSVVWSNGIRGVVGTGGYGGASWANVVPFIGGLPPGFAGNHGILNTAALTFNIADVNAALGGPSFVVRLDYQTIAMGVKLQINGINLAAPDFVPYSGMIIGGMMVLATPTHLELNGVATGTPITQFSVAGQALRFDSVTFN